MPSIDFNFNQWLIYLFSAMAVATLLGLLLLLWSIWRIKQIELPPNANFMTTLRHTPFTVVLMLDLLDFGLDIFAAPITWVVLGRLGLLPLRGVTLIEGLIPGTQPIPLMTVTWIMARFTKTTL